MAAHSLLEELPIELGLTILSHLTAEELARAATVSATLHDWATDELLWRAHCVEDWGVDVHTGQTDGLSWMATYGAWRTSFAGLSVSQVVVARRAIERVVAAATHKLSDVVFFPPASAANIDAAAARIGVPIPYPLSVWYRYVGGEMRNMVGPSPALFGGFRVYNTLQLCHMDSVDDLAVIDGSDIVCFATTWGTRSRPAHALGVQQDGCIVVLSGDRDIVPLVADPDVAPAQSANVWATAYADAVLSGELQAAEIVSAADLRSPFPATAISLFATAGPRLFRAVTSGVVVEAAPLYMGYFAQSTHLWAYRITVYLDDDTDMPYPAYQLTSRFWEVVDGDGSVDTVQGDGVIGQFPKLTAGVGPTRANPFSYCSQTTLNVAGGSMSGELTFVRGSIEQQAPGPPLVVQVPRFALDVPPIRFT